MSTDPGPGRGVGHVALGAWSGGRYLAYGQTMDEERLQALLTPGDGIHTVLTADAYGMGEADTVVGRAVAGLDRESFCLVGAVGHDFYEGEREGPKGFPASRTRPCAARTATPDYLRMATERHLERLGVDELDVLLLHNPDRTGYSSPVVWDAMAALRDDGPLAGQSASPRAGERLHAGRHRLPGALRRRHRLGHADPQPVRAVARGARTPRRGATEVSVIARVADYGGMFWEDVSPGHPFAPSATTGCSGRTAGSRQASRSSKPIRPSPSGTA